MRQLTTSILKGLLIFLFFIAFSPGSPLEPKRRPSGLFSVIRNGKVGFIDREGRIVIEPAFEMAEAFSEGLAQVTITTNPESNPVSRQGYIDMEGHLAIKPEFSEAYDFSEGLALVKDKTGLYGFIDSRGQWTISPQFHDARGEGFSEGLAGVAKNGEMGIC